MLARNIAKPGEPLSGSMLELFRCLRSCILSLKESGDEPNRLARHG